MKKFIAAIGSIFLLQSCASVMTGKMQTVTFISEPQGSKVVVDGENIGITPVTKEIPRKSSIITYSLDGHKDYTLKIKKSSNSWTWGNFAFLPLAGVGPLVGVLIDQSNGSGYEIKKVITPEGQITKINNSTINVTLKK